MNIWGIVIAVIGALLSLAGFTKSDFIIYRILILRSTALWKEKVHTFYTIVGIIMFVFGILVATNVI